jgi:hypothetical protein
MKRMVETELIQLSKLILNQCHRGYQPHNTLHSTKDSNQALTQDQAFKHTTKLSTPKRRS